MDGIVYVERSGKRNKTFEVFGYNGHNFETRHFLTVSRAIAYAVKLAKTLINDEDGKHEVRIEQGFLTKTMLFEIDKYKGPDMCIGFYL